MIVLRSLAVAVAVFAIVDPEVTWPRRERPAVRVLGSADDGERQRVVATLEAAGFSLAASGEAAAIATADTATIPALPSPPFYVVATDAGARDVTLLGASVSGSRVAEQAIAVGFTVRARGGRGAITRVRLEDGGLTVASTSHRWSEPDEAWRGTLSFLPFTPGPIRLRVRVDTLPGEHRTADNAIDVLVPAMRGPIRTLVLELGVTWPATFVRRALEGAPGFAVAAVQRATKIVATRAGSPPRALARADLAPYEVVVVGQPGSLDANAVETLRWFVEQRGGVALVVPDQVPKGVPGGLLGDVSFEPRTLDHPIALSGNVAGLMAAELAIPRGLSPLAMPLASDPAGTPIVFAMRRGMGAVVVSGALDAWRYRDRDDAAFARFWQGAVMQQAGAVPPRVEVTAIPALTRPGDAVRVTVRLRETELPGAGDRVVLPSVSLRAVSAAPRGESVIRLWPSAEPGVFEGEWRPASPGDYVLDASAGAAEAMGGATLVQVAADVAPRIADPEALAAAARATGGGVVDGAEALARTLDARLASRIIARPSRPARSLWCAAVFAALLCGEWALRRRRGLA